MCNVLYIHNSWPYKSCVRTLHAHRLITNVRIGRYHRYQCYGELCNVEVLLRRGLVCLECALSLFIRTLDIAIWYSSVLNFFTASATTQLSSCGLWLVIPAAANANVQSDLNKQVGLWWHWWKWGIWPPSEGNLLFTEDLVELCCGKEQDRSK